MKKNGHNVLHPNNGKWRIKLATFEGCTRSRCMCLRFFVAFFVIQCKRIGARVCNQIIIKAFDNSKTFMYAATVTAGIVLSNHRIAFSLNQNEKCCDVTVLHAVSMLQTTLLHRSESACLHAMKYDSQLALKDK